MADSCTPLQFTLNGRRWRFVRQYLPDCRINGHAHDTLGDTDPPSTKNKAVRVNKKLTGLKELDIILHEVRHAENFDMYDEGYVKKISGEVASLLWRIGYRKLSPGEITALEKLRDG